MTKLSLTKIFTSLLLLFTFTIAQSALPQVVYACGSASGNSQNQVLYGVGQTGGTCSGNQVTSTISAAVNILSYIVGIAAVIMVIISGFKYITSGGDTNAVSSAKTTLIYALIGVAIAVLAQVLVHYVINSAA